MTTDQDLIALSKQKWAWMSAQDVTPLAKLFHDDAVFVHMGATFTKPEELNVIKTGYIHELTVPTRTPRYSASSVVVHH